MPPIQPRRPLFILLWGRGPDILKGKNRGIVGIKLRRNKLYTLRGINYFYSNLLILLKCCNPYIDKIQYIAIFKITLQLYSVFLASYLFCIKFVKLKH